jgi:UDP-N-acetylglucosamine transferase subunit ALG13
MMKCFVTVGSTKFESLISTLFNDEILQTFSDIDIKNVHIQNGNGTIPDCFQPEDTNDECWAARVGGIKVFSIIT